MQLKKTIIPLLCAGGVVLGALWTSLSYAQSKSVAEELIEILEADGKISHEKADELRQRAKVEDEAREVGVEAFRRDPVKAVKEDKSFDWLNRLSFFGDVRYRVEGFYQEHGPSAVARTRERVRLRLGMRAKISDELEGVLRLASGNPNDPISTNQSLDNLFSKKSFNLDQAYITFAPGKSFGLERWEWKPLTITAGKMSNTLWRPKAIMSSEMIFDDDLTPEGTAETFTPYQASEGIVRSLQINAVQWLARESSHAAEAFTWGGQVIGKFSLLPKTNLTLAVGDYFFSHQSLFAKEKNSNGSLVVTNAVKLKDGTIVKGGSSFSPKADNPIVDFVSGFNIVNVGAQLDYDTGYAKWPFSLFVDYAHNTDAVGGKDNAVWAGAGIGALKDPGDMAFSVAWGRVETEAIMSMFNYSDFGRSGGTNVQGPFVKIDYRLLPHLTLTAKNHFVSFIDRPKGESNSTLNRLQLDAVLSF